MDDREFPYSLTDLANALSRIDMSCVLPLLQSCAFTLTDEEGVTAQFRYDVRTGQKYFEFGSSWCKDNILCEEEMTAVIMHEFFHCLLGYYGGWDPYLTEAYECLINQMIAVTVQGSDRYLGVLRRLFWKKPFPENFRCDATKPESYLQKRVYETLYRYEPMPAIEGVNEDDAREYDTSFTHYLHPDIVRVPVRLPILCQTLDPKTLADFFASQFPENERLPRDKESWEKEIGKGVQILVGQGLPSDLPDTPMTRKLRSVLGNFGMQTFGDVPDPGSEERPGTFERALNDYLSQAVLQAMEEKSKQDISNKFPQDHTRRNQRAVRYNNRLSRAAKKTMTGHHPYLHSQQELLRALQMDTENGPWGGPAGRRGSQGILARIKLKKKLRIQRVKLSKDVSKVSEISDLGRIKLALKAWSNRARDWRPNPSFVKDRRATSLVIQGALPTKYKQPGGQTAHGLTHVYIDASGSVEGMIPTFLAFLQGCSEWICPTLHVFSTEVFDMSKVQVLKGGYFRTTGGTTFDCIISHMQSNGIRSALVLTDGYLSAEEGTYTRAVRDKYRFLTLLTPHAAEKCQLYDLSHVVAPLTDYSRE